MKKLLIVLAIATMSVAASAEEKGIVPKTTKTVCKDVVGKDGKPAKNKDGSVRQACKTIRIHKKHEGTEIPPKK
jgi:hypothetical protein